MTPSRRATLAFAAVLATAALAVVGLHTTRAGEDAMVRAFHLRPATSAEFAALQVLPTMYAAQNRVWISNQPLDWAEIDTQAPVAIFVPHYPASFVTGSPRNMRQTPCPRYAALETRLRGRVSRSHLRVDATEAGIRLVPVGEVPNSGCSS